MQIFDLIIRNGTIIDGSGAPAFIGDVAVQDGKIAEIGKISNKGHEEIDASGKLVTPGFVDIHTHYDGQAIWSNAISPSSGQGVTTAVMSNCGVGFAPCRAQDRQRLVSLMEGVEDIPGVVMTEGLTWEWETYPQFLDAVEARPHDINLASYLPHSPLRVYVMGDRATAEHTATPADITRMTELVKEATAAGALGFSTSRTLFHRSSDGGLIPTLNAGEEELTAISKALEESGTGILQFAADYRGYDEYEEEFAMLARIAKAGDRVLTMPIAQLHSNPDGYKHILGLLEKANADGVKINGQVLPRGLGMMFGLQLSVHPFFLTPTYKTIADLPLPERVAKMRDPAIRAQILSEPPGEARVPLERYSRLFDGMYAANEVIDYEPVPEESSIKARAERAGVTPEELAYDLLLEQDGRAILFMPFINYGHGNLDAALEMFRHSNVVPGLGDGGAHYGIICDASYSTFLLSHWTRDRSRGERMQIPEVVRAMAHDTAAMVGLNDRGLIAIGYNADLNVIDYDRLTLPAPTVIHDLPGGGRRLDQKAEGFVATIVNGEVISRNGVSTGALPGRLIRGQQPAPAPKGALAFT